VLFGLGELAEKRHAETDRDDVCNLAGFHFFSFEFGLLLRLNVRLSESERRRINSFTSVDFRAVEVECCIEGRREPSAPICWGSMW
jgi:hypothetical protein